MAGKTVCVVARAQRVPEFVASGRDKDTDSCRVFPFGASALVADIRYAGERWARVALRLPLLRLETVERVQRQQLAATERTLERAARAAERRWRRAAARGR